MFMYKVLNNDKDFLSYVIAVRALKSFSYLDLLYGIEKKLRADILLQVCKVFSVLRRVTRIEHALLEAPA